MTIPAISIVANRGPHDFVFADGQWVTRPASGGLVSMLEPLARQAGVRWYCCVSEPPDADDAREGLFATAEDQLDPAFNVVPIPVPAKQYHAYYGRISNEVLWFLQHGVLGSDGLAELDAARHRAWHSGYVATNQRMAKRLAEDPAPDAFLLQDYHLYLLPALLRERFPSTPILHFTHIPFPEPSALGLLPAAWRRAILDGLLGADVVGVQTPGDIRAFLGCCAQLLGAAVDETAMTVTAPDGRLVQVIAFPASTDPADLAALMAGAEVAAARERLAPPPGMSTIVRVDRLDPGKNQVIGFRAFARLLELRPDLVGRVRFQAFLVPSRTDLAVYRAYRDEVYATIEAINARFGTGTDGPAIEVFYTNDRAQALAALEACDVLLVNSRQDGMNLVAKEWAIVSRKPGVLVLSETAGAASEATGSALLVAALDSEGTARALAEALDMPTDQRWHRLLPYRERVHGWTAAHWLQAQLDTLRALHQRPRTVVPVGTPLELVAPAN